MSDTEDFPPPGGYPPPGGQPPASPQSFPPSGYPPPGPPQGYPPSAPPYPAQGYPAAPGYPAYPPYPPYPGPGYPPLGGPGAPQGYPGYPPGYQLAAYPPEPEPPTDPLPYHLVYRGGRSSWWRSLVGIIVAAIGTFVVAGIAWIIPFMIVFALLGEDVMDRTAALGDLHHVTPTMLAYLNLTLASAIPIAWFCIRVFHGLKPRWLASVRPRIRWGYFFVCLGLAVLALGATMLVGILLPGTSGSDSGGTNEFTSTTRDFLLVIVLLTPFQAAGEEYLFRGYLTQAVGGWFGNRVLAVLIPSVLFALAHGAQSIPVFFDRFAFGLVAGILVIATGGLEAGIAMHVLNNFLAYGLALAFGDMTSALNPPAGSWWDMIPTLTQSLVYLGLATWVARRMGLATKTDPAVLAASRGLVYRFPPASTPAAPA